MIRFQFPRWAVFLVVFGFLFGCGQPVTEPAATEPAFTEPTASPVSESPNTADTSQAEGPFQATGMKIGEVTDSQAIVWTRLTRLAERIGTEAPMPEFLYRAPGEEELQAPPPGRFHPHDWSPVVIYPEGSSIEFIEGAVIGAIGETRIVYRKVNGETWQSTAWIAVDAEMDFTRQFTLSRLSPATDYELRVEGRAVGSNTVSSSLDGVFGTAPLPNDPARVVFTSVTGTAYDDQDTPEGGFQIHQAMIDLDADFFVHTGDIIYYDAWAKNVALARWGWARMFSLASKFNFHRTIPTYFMKDDHDVWMDDTWPSQVSSYMGELTFQDGVELFTEQVPMEDRTYRTFRWGQDVQIWVVEGRDFRSANMDPDGPDKTIWGPEQIAWFKETVLASDATFRILISPTPFVGPDIEGKFDSHANDSFATEGNDLRQFMADLDNMIVICGDRHWQYVSVDADTGLREYATGSASDSHAGAWLSNDDVRPEHRYVNIIGGFLSVTAERSDGVPTLAMRHHHVDGSILFEDTLTETILAAD
jgi:alkaline phosphatase D